MIAAALGLFVLLCSLFGGLIVRNLSGMRRDRQIQALVATFGSLAAQAREHPRRLLAWHPIAEQTRQLFPDAFRALESVDGKRFPFSKELIESVEAKWTAEWLEWERNNDTEYRAQSAAIEATLEKAEASATQAARARLDTLERDRLEQYQRRYQEYVEVSRGLAALAETTADAGTTEP